MNEQVKIPKAYIDILDQIFEVERKVEAILEPNSLIRNINRLKEIFESISSSGTDAEAGLTYYNPIGEPYSDTRTDLEASIAGDSAENLFITEVIKPIIRYRRGGSNLIARKGVVVVESRKNIS